MVRQITPAELRNIVNEMGQEITYPQPEDFAIEGTDEIDWCAYYEAMELIELEQNGVR